MGVRFAREYRDINEDFLQALLQIEDVYECFEMDQSEWSSLMEEERAECVRTLADDVFYGLGTDPQMSVGSGTVAYDLHRHVITVATGSGTVYVVRLI